jgi:hypothetical protein
MRVEPPDDPSLRQAREKMDAVVKLVGEQTDFEKEVIAILVLSEMWASIGDDLKASVEFRNKLLDENQNDLKTLASLAADRGFEVTTAEYRVRSERFLGILLSHPKIGGGGDEFTEEEERL